MRNFIMAVALGVSAVAVMVAHHHDARLSDKLRQKEAQVSFLQVELRQTKQDLAVAKSKLGFLDRYKQHVQVTAYTAQPGSVFHNGMRTSHAYAVQGHTLPEDHMIYVGLSNPAQAHLHARMNDLIVLIPRRGNKKILAKFVDTGTDAETRAVVDVYFANERQAIIWGRRTEYYAVNVSSRGSPFRE